jgi:preprotein translocase subunit YajC
MMVILLPILLMVGMMIFMNRGEKKKRAALESQLKRGDRVITRSGIKGKLVELGESTAKVEIAPGVNVVMLKVAIEGVDPGEVSATAGKDGKAGGKDAKEGASSPSDAKDAKDKKK